MTFSLLFYRFSLILSNTKIQRQKYTNEFSQDNKCLQDKSIHRQKQTQTKTHKDNSLLGIKSHTDKSQNEQKTRSFGFCSVGLFSVWAFIRVGFYCGQLSALALACVCICPVDFFRLIICLRALVRLLNSKF